MAQYDVQRKAIEQKNSCNSSTRTVQLRRNSVESIIQMAKMNPERLTQNDVMVLQKTMGNVAVSQLIKGAGDKQNEIVQKKDEKSQEEEYLQMKVGANIFQRVEMPSDEQSLQIKKENNTGLPDNLKAGVENLSGVAMDDVRVHYNSDRPTQVGALAYTQGTDIHVATGQEKHLPHEAWHVVQQAQGRVKATTQMKGIAVNDDVGLEKEADEMGRSSLGFIENSNSTINSLQDKQLSNSQRMANNGSVIHQYIIATSQGIQEPIQFVETLEQKIKRILANRNIDINDTEASEYATFLSNNKKNTEIQVKGHNRALKLNEIGVVSSIARRPPANASNMRVSPSEGPMDEDSSSMVVDGPRPLTGAIIQQDATISAAMLSDIPERANLKTVMGGSAAQLSGIANSEWLHLVAHSLGGVDEPQNLVAGPHSLNTAMIPFECFVRSSARAGRIVDYDITFFASEVSSVMYVHHVQIGITFPQKKGIWTLEVNQQNMSEFINGQVLADIQNHVDTFATR